MKRIVIAMLIALFALPAVAALLTDPVSIYATHCVWQFDGGADVVLPVTQASAVPPPNTGAAGTKVCYATTNPATEGAHTARVAQRYVDPTTTYPTVTSPFTAALAYTIGPTPPPGGVLPAPTGQRLVP